MSLLTAFGFCAVCAMLICYALERRAPIYILAISGGLRLRIALWIPAERLAVWRRRGGLVGGGPSALDSDARALMAASQIVRHKQPRASLR
jgi:hypothetical protein